jgi:hypothetical protein
MDTPSRLNAQVIDVEGARTFVATHGRMLERRRLQFLLDGGEPSGVLAALDGYRNEDGGYGWGLEPDLRSPESQPAAAMHALEVLAEAAPTSPRAVETLDWLAAHSRPDGGLPFALPSSDTAGTAPWWLASDAVTSSLQMTAQVAANAHLVARRSPAVRSHPWLARATDWCLSTIGALEQAPTAYELLFSVHFLDAAAEVAPRATEVLDHLARFIPEDGIVPVQGGAEGEAVRALQLAPLPGGPARRLFSDEVIERELRRLTSEQRPDGGWTVDFVSASPAASLEWRGYATVEALITLRSNADGHDWLRTPR